MSIHQVHPSNTADGVQRSKLEQYFDIVLEAFETAQSKTESISFDYLIGGFGVRLCFAGMALVPKLTAAFEHLAVKDERSPAFTIHLWDSASTNVNLPDFLWEIGEIMYQGEVWVADTDIYKLTYHPGEGYLRFLDIERNKAIYWTVDASKIPYYESGSPLKYILNWWLGCRGKQLIHAGAIGIEDGGVLLVGKGGSGKSTTALACLDAGLLYLSDDYCVVDNEQKPNVYSIYCTGKLNAEDHNRFPNLKAALSNGPRLGSEKALYFLYQLVPHLFRISFPIRAILLPKIVERTETKLIPVSPAQGFLAIAPSTIFQLRGVKLPIHQHVGQLVKKVSCYELELGSNIQAIPEVILDFLWEKS